MTEAWHPFLTDSDTVVGLEFEDGASPAREFIDALPDNQKAKFQRYFERLRDHQRIASPENMRHLKSDTLGNEVHELKTHADGGRRLYLVKSGVRWHATHGRRKPKDNKVNSEIGKAFELFYEWETERKDKP